MGSKACMMEDKKYEGCRAALLTAARVAEPDDQHRLGITFGLLMVSSTMHHQLQDGSLRCCRPTRGCRSW